MLQGRVRRQDRVVGLDNRARQLGRGVHTELELRLLAVVVSKALHKQSAEAGTSSTPERMEDEEALKTRAVVGETADCVHNRVNQLLANGIVATSV